MILDQIVCARKDQLAREKAEATQSELESRIRLLPPARDFAKALRDNALAVIAECKKASPSKGVIAQSYDPAAIAKAYENAGANAISVLTEERFFLGSNEHLKQVRAAVNLPILRKDFVIDPVQILHARSMGADAVLLIAALLPRPTLDEFRRIAESVGLAALIEVHDEAELETALCCGAELIGINNRNLKTFAVSLDVTRRLAARIPNGKIVVSESGISTNDDMVQAKECGAHAVLIGETLMKSGDVIRDLSLLRKETGEGTRCS